MGVCMGGVGASVVALPRTITIASQKHPTLLDEGVKRRKLRVKDRCRSLLKRIETGERI